jgi:hypothetical protein
MQLQLISRNLAQRLGDHCGKPLAGRLVCVARGMLEGRDAPAMVVGGVWSAKRGMLRIRGQARHLRRPSPAMLIVSGALASSSAASHTCVAWRCRSMAANTGSSPESVALSASAVPGVITAAAATMCRRDTVVMVVMLSHGCLPVPDDQEIPAQASPPATRRPWLRVQGELSAGCPTLPLFRAEEEFAVSPSG